MSFAEVGLLLTNFEPKLCGKKVTFIPTAYLVEEVDFFGPSAQLLLKQLGLVVKELELTTASAQEIAAAIRESDVIYIAGGNTFFLLQEMRRSGVDQFIIESVHQGKFYIGESTGSIITAPNIGYAKAMDSVAKAPDLDNYEALGLVDFYPLPHYNNEPFAAIIQQIVQNYTATLSLQPISSHEVILVRDHEVTIDRI